MFIQIVGNTFQVPRVHVFVVVVSLGSYLCCVIPLSVCADNNHVRTWTVTRFRGMISTQPGSTPLSSFKILSLDDIDGHAGCGAGIEIGQSH